MMLRQEGKLDEALAHIETALRVRQADAGALYQRASIHSVQGLTEKARQELEALIRDSPDFAEAHAALATVYYRLRRKEEGDRERDAAPPCPARRRKAFGRGAETSPAQGVMSRVDHPASEVRPKSHRISRREMWGGQS